MVTINAGDFDTRATLLKPVQSIGKIGNSHLSYEPVGNIWLQKMPKSTATTVDDAEVILTDSLSVRTWWNHGLTSAYRLDIGGIEYEIVSLIDVENKQILHEAVLSKVAR